jgi:hypothetical protein
MKPDAMGGYFGLELPARSDEFHPGAMRFQSARAAFLALLRAHRPTAVWMPWYICDSMLEPLRMTGTRVVRYEIDARLRVFSATPAEGEWLLYVNYFGLCANNVDDVLRRFPRDQVVIDQSQAFFTGPAACLANLYSPRKFFGVPDGGYLTTTQPVPAPMETDDLSFSRATHLLKRPALGAEAGYADYCAAEAGLRMQEPKQMSALTQHILAGIGYAEVRARRAANYAFLDAALGHLNQFAFEGYGDGAPLCYPFLGAPTGSRERLSQERIYTPSYWQDVVDEPAAPEFERTLAGNALFLPCDQRLSRPQLERMVDILLKHLEHS